MEPDIRQVGLVTVIIAVYNAGAFLRPSVESILAQTYTHLQVLLVDDGTSDGCVDTIRYLGDPRLQIFHQPNSGKPVALNLALEHCRGEFYALHDADDLSHPDRIARQVECLRQHPNVGCVLTGYELLLNGQHLAPTFRFKGPEECRQDVARLAMPGLDPTAMYRMSMVQNLRYDGELPVVEGYDHLMRVGELMPMMVLGHCLYTYRVHTDSVTRRNPERRWRLLQKALRKARTRRGLTIDETFPQAPPKWRNRDIDNDLVSHFMESVLDLRHTRRRRDALRAALVCSKLHPLDLYYYKPLTYGLLPLQIVDGYRRLRFHAIKRRIKPLTA